MTFVKISLRIGITIAVATLVTGCGGSDSSTSSRAPTCSSTLTKTPSGVGGANGANVLTMTVNGNLCSNSAYENEPCASVTICQAGTSNCQTINNILVDTGSYGLRLFSSVISEPLVSVSCSDSGVLAECLSYGDGSSDWGPVQYADVKLGGEPAVTIPIQVINSNFSNPPAQCSSSQSYPDTAPSEAGFNGILGVGLQAQDCGSLCTTSADAQQYYSCTDSSCNPAIVPLNTQVPNPVSLLPTDNNGVIFELPTINAAGVASVSGSLILGIGTQSNNVPASVKVFGATISDLTGSPSISALFTAFSPAPIPAFIDSGSNQLYIPTPGGNQLPDCGDTYGSNYEGYFCPTTTQSLTATNLSLNSNVSDSVSFSVANAYTLVNSGNSVFSNLASSIGLAGNDAIFDWGLPFFFGRNVYMGIQGTQSSLGTGPYWAY